MGLFSSLWRSTRRALGITKSRGERLFSQLIGGQGITLPGAWTADRTIQVQQFDRWTYVAINAIAEEVACQLPKVARRVGPDELKGTRAKSLRLLDRRQRQKALIQSLQPDEEIEPADHEHPLCRLLANPNGPDTAWTFWYRSIMYLELTGSFYWWQIRSKNKGEDGRGLPVELWVLPSQWVWPRYGGSEERIIDYYEIRPYGIAAGTGAYLHIHADDIISCQYPHPTNPFDGQSKLAAGAPWVDVAKSIDASRWAQMKQNGWPGLTVELSPEYHDPSDDEIDAFRQKLMAIYSGERNTGKPLIVTPGVKVTATSRTPVEQDYNASFDQMRDTALALHRVGKSVVGIAEDVNRASAYQVRRNFIYGTLRPKFMLIDGVVTEKLARQFDKNLIVYHEDSTPDDPELKLQTWNAAMGNGTCTANEYRHNVLGLEPYEHGGDDPILGLSMSVMPLNTGDEMDKTDMPAAAATRFGGEDIDPSTPEEPKGSASGVNKMPAPSANGHAANGKAAMPTDDPSKAPETPAGQPQVHQTPERAELLQKAGGIKSVLDILTGVSEGTIGRGSAIKLLSLFYGLTPQDAAALLADTKEKPEEPPPMANGIPPQNGQHPSDKPHEEKPESKPGETPNRIAAALGKSTRTVSDFRRRFPAKGAAVTITKVATPVIPTIDPASEVADGDDSTKPDDPERARAGETPEPSGATDGGGPAAQPDGETASVAADHAGSGDAVVPALVPPGSNADRPADDAPQVDAVVGAEGPG